MRAGKRGVTLRAKGENFRANFMQTSVGNLFVTDLIARTSRGPRLNDSNIVRPARRVLQPNEMIRFRRVFLYLQLPYIGSSPARASPAILRTQITLPSLSRPINQDDHEEE